MAGFTDADGCISLNNSNNQAFYSLGNYKNIVLKQVRNSLIRFAVPCPKLVLGYKKGWTNKEGYKRRGDYWMLTLTRKKTLLSLFAKLEPHLKHPKKLKGIKVARKNIFQRNEKYGYIGMD